jgi:hypothetical protein
MLCKYRHIFGEEGKGVHSYRIANIAVVDLGLTLLVGLFISKWFRVNLYWTWLTLIVLGILVHRLFCVDTTINQMIFGKTN